MSARWLDWYRARSLREQYLLAAAGGMVLLALCYFLLVPLGDALESAKARHADAVVRLADTQARVDAVKAAQADRASPPAEPLEARVRASANDAGFALAAVIPQGSDRLQISIASARPGALIGWLADLEASGVLVGRLATTDNGDRTVAVQLTLQAQGQ